MSEPTNESLENLIPHIENAEHENFELIEAHQDAVLIAERNFQELRTLRDQLFSDTDVVPQSLKTVNITEVANQISQIAEKLVATPESLLESRRYEADLSQLKKFLSGQYEEANQKYWRQRMVSQDISNEINYLEWKRFKRFPKIQRAIRKILLGRKLSKEEAKTQMLNSEQDAAEKLYQNAVSLHTLLRDKQIELFKKYGREQLNETVKAYEVFAQQLTVSQSVLRPIQMQFIRDKIFPSLFSQLRDGKISQESTINFVKDLLTFLEHRESDQDTTNSLTQLKTHLWHPGKFSDYLHLCNILIAKTDQKQVQNLVEHEAYVEVIRVRELMNSVHGQSSWRNSREDTFRTLRTNNNSLMFPFAPKPLALDEYGNISEQINFDLWPAINNSNELKPLYGELITQQNAELYSQIIDNALSDREGTYIQKLDIYPKPNSIRALCLIAAADYQNYRTYHANSVLTRLAKRQDWPTLIESTIAEFPEIEKVRDQLINWNFEGYYSNSVFKSAFSNAAFEIVSQTNDGTDQRIFTLAAECLPNQNLVPKVKETNQLSEQQIEWLRQALIIAEMTVHSNHTGYAFGNTFRRWAIIIASDPSQIDIAKNTLGSLASISKKILESQSKPAELDYYLTIAVALLDIGQDDRTLEAILQLPNLCPTALASHSSNVHEILKKNPDLLSVQSLPSLNNLLVAYGEFSSVLPDISLLLSNKSLTMQRAIEIPTLHPDLLSRNRFHLVSTYPDLYLSDTSAVNYFLELETVYSDRDSSILYEVSKSLSKGLPKEIAKILPKQLSIIFDNTMNLARANLFDNPMLALKDMRQIKFLKEFIGNHGVLANQLIADWVTCLQKEAILPNDFDVVTEFCGKFRLMTPEIIGDYKKARENGQGDIFLQAIKASAQSLIQSRPPTETERSSSYYSALIRGIFPNNAGQYGSYEASATCGDRTNDIAKYQIKDRYQLDIVDVESITLKNGESLTKEAIHPITDVIYNVAHSLEEQSYDPELMRAQLTQEVATLVLTAQQSTDPEFKKQLSEASLIEEQLFLLLIATKFGNMKHLEPAVKKILISYEFINFQDVREYISGTNDRVNGSINPDYSLLTELHSFYADRLKEINRKIIKTAWQNTSIQNYLKEVYKRIAQEKVVEEKYVLAQKLRIENLGLSEQFLKRIASSLKKNNGKNYTVEKVAALINRYERMTRGFTQMTSGSGSDEAQAIAGQIISQKNKTISAWQALTGQQLDPSTVFLNEINLGQFMQHLAQNAVGTISDEGYANYTGEQFSGLFEAELLTLEGELNKFESKSGNKRKLLYGYICKTKESANARMVGGVCVSQDTPRNNAQNMWDMDNYFQFVYQDPDTLRCVGLCLLHEYEDQGKKVLTASLNPSATYLQTVDEKMLFDRSLDELTKFAQKNGFDMVCLSSNKAIRTNRTGGQFEKAIETQVSKTNKKFTFSEPKVFSYSPSYSMREMDIVWERNEGSKNK